MEFFSFVCIHKSVKKISVLLTKYKPFLLLLKEEEEAVSLLPWSEGAAVLTGAGGAESRSTGVLGVVQHPADQLLLYLGL